METVDIKVCVRPYYHDVVDEIRRKPKYSAKEDKHYITYKGRNHILVKNGNAFVIWVEDV